jgi:tRNA A58 N-methylase Trm61
MEYVELKNKDITAGIDETGLDAVILDMATPWLVVPHAYKALKPCGTLVSFSPTIDQTIKTVEALKENGFIDIETVECSNAGNANRKGQNKTPNPNDGPHRLYNLRKKTCKYANQVD